MDEELKCKCGGCFCSPANAQLMEAAIARYSDRSSFANNTAQDNVNFMSASFQANANNTLNSSTAEQLAFAILSQRSVANQPNA